MATQVGELFAVLTLDDAAFTEALNRAQGGLGALSEALVAIRETAAGALSGGEGLGLSGLLAGMDGDGFDPEPFFALGQTVAETVAQGIGAGTPAAAQAADAVRMAALTAVQPMEQDMIQVAQIAMAGLEGGIAGAAGAVASAAAGTADAGVRAAESRLSYGEGYGIGSNFGSAMASGIASTAGMLASAAMSAVSQAVSAAKGALSIHSPSGVGLDIGENFGGAIAMGLEKMTGRMALATDTAMSALTQPFVAPEAASSIDYTRIENALAGAGQGRQADIPAREIGEAMADRLIARGALNQSLYLDGEKVGQAQAGAVAREMKRESRASYAGRSAGRGVVG